MWCDLPTTVAHPRCICRGLGPYELTLSVGVSARRVAHDPLPDSEDAQRLTLPVTQAILRYIVKYPASDLDRTFAALADPTRRAVLVRLLNGDEHNPTRVYQEVIPE